MLNHFKNTLTLSITVFIAVLLSLSLLPSCAQENAPENGTTTTTTYYAFVMQKRSSGDWQIPQSPLKKGDAYRFQIVVHPNPVAEAPTKWFTVRGEINFQVAQIVVANRKNLDTDKNDHGLNDPEHSPWRQKTQSTWENVRDKILQPLIDKETIRGGPDPKFLNFLIQSGKEVSWKDSANKNYYLYRLHHLQADDFEKEDFKKALSRFINPEQEAPTTDIKEIKGWVNGETAFTKAKYVDTPDKAHQDFYADFKKWFDNPPKESTPEPEIKKVENPTQPTTPAPKKQNDDNDDTTLLWKIVYSSLAIVVIFAIFAVAWFLSSKLDDSTPNKDDEFADEPEPQSPKKRKSQKTVQKSSGWFFGILPKKFKDSKTDKVQPNAVPSVSRKEFDSLTKQLQQVVQQRVQNSPESKRTESAMRPDEVRQIVAQELRSMMAEEFAKQFDNQVSRLLQNPAFQEAVKEAVKTEINASMTQVNTYLNEKLKEIIDNQVEKRIKQHLNRLLQKESLTQKRNEKGRDSDENQPWLNKTMAALAPPQPKFETVANRQISEQREESARQKTPAPEDREESARQKTLTPVDDNGINEIKTLLLSMKVVDETALNTLETNVKADEFVENVVAKCLKLNQPHTHYQRLDSGIQEITKKQVSLIIPNSGDEFNPNEHNAVVQQTANKGKLNVVTSLTRPGVKCDNVVKRKAEVVQTV